MDTIINCVQSCAWNLVLTAVGSLGISYLGKIISSCNVMKLRSVWFT